MNRRIRVAVVAGTLLPVSLGIVQARGAPPAGVPSVGMIIAGPAAQTVGYTTTTVFIPEGGQAEFDNTDPTNQHDVVSKAVRPDGKPLFRSELDSLYLPDAVDVEGTA